MINKKTKKQYHSEWYARNRVDLLRRRKKDRKERGDELRRLDRNHRRKRYAEIRRWLYDNIEALSCLDCGLSFGGQYWMADFHHNNKRKKSGEGILTFVNRVSYSKIVKELDDGAFLCPNCHRIHHRRTDR